MKTKLILFMATIFLLFNSCKKQAQLIFKSRFYGRAYDNQTKESIAGIKIYATRIDKYIYQRAINYGGPLYLRYERFDSTTTDENGHYKLKFKNEINFEYSVSVGKIDKTKYTGYYLSNWLDNSDKNDLNRKIDIMLLP
jgi:hypothetical protein